MCYLILYLTLFMIISKGSAQGFGFVGGVTNSDVDDPEIKDVAEKAMVQVNQQTKSKYLYKLEKIIGARTQVVSGVKYYLRILAAPTRSGITNAATCAVNKNKPKKVEYISLKPNEEFNIEVWSAPWQNTFSVTLT
uniref:Cystatin domain-containing protein n=1 Tax=Setaria digitata TaxID=48799 RepID=A0A915PUX9_9BILA